MEARKLARTEERAGNARKASTALHMPNTKRGLACHLIAWRPKLLAVAAKIDTTNWAVLRILYVAYCLADT